MVPIATPPAARAAANRSPWRKRWLHTWPRLRRSLGIGFLAVVAALLISQIRHIDWPQVNEAVQAYSPSTLWAAAALALLSHAIYCSFDLLGRAWTGHPLPVTRVLPVTFVSYAFNLNFGSLVGGAAFRFRLYSQMGLAQSTITRVWGLSLTTNWLGYLTLAGALFAFGFVTPPQDWKIGAIALQALGGAMLLAASAYLMFCTFAHHRSWALRGQQLTLPSGRLAGLQWLLSCANWVAMGWLLHVLLPASVDYPSVLGALLVAALAGVVTHIPAGLGVLEAVFIALLGARIPQGHLIGAILAYRAVYYLAPLLIAAAVYLVLELQHRSPAHPAIPRDH